MQNSITIFTIAILITLFGYVNPVNSQEIEEPLSENATVDQLAQAFLNQAESHQTIWAEADAIRFAEGLLDILENYQEELGDESIQILREHLEVHVKEMADTVLTNGHAPTEYIDAFLSDYTDRIIGLIKRDGPIFPDESTMNAIKNDLSELMEYVCQDLEPTEQVSSELIEDIKDSILQDLHSRAEHPLRAEFKVQLEESELLVLKEHIRTNLADVDFSELSEETYDSGVRVILNAKRAVRRQITSYLISNWHAEPLLTSSEETSELYKLAFEIMTGQEQEQEQGLGQENVPGVNSVNSQELLGPRILDTVRSLGERLVRNMPMAVDSNNRVYVGDYSEVLVYTQENGLRPIAGTGEEGTITEGIATEVPMTVQSIAIGPQDRLHILSDSYIGRLDENGIIELLEFETETGEITNKIKTTTENPLVKHIVFNESGELFISTLDSTSTDLGYVVHKVVDNKLTPYIGGGGVSLLGGNSENPYRLDVKLDSVSALRIIEDTIYFSIVDDQNYFVYNITSSENVQLVAAKLSKVSFVPITENTLLVQGSLNTESTNTEIDNLRRNSVSLYSPEQERITYLTDIPSLNGWMSFGYDNNNGVLYTAARIGYHVFLFSIPEIESYTTTNISDWNYHE